MTISVITSAIAALMGLKRTCPKCLGDQVVCREEKQETVSCKFCGASIPPPRLREADD